jgi:hypothetical protein
MSSNSAVRKSRAKASLLAQYAHRKADSEVRRVL